MPDTGLPTLLHDTDYASLQEAAEWYATLQSGSADNAQRTRWQQWLAQSASHVTAWAHVEAVSKRFDPLRVDGERDAAEAGLKQARGRGANRRQILRGMASLGGLTVLGLVSWRYTPLRRHVLAWNADYSTGTGELRDITLPDGTQVWLNTSSALDVDYNSALRKLRLLSGEIHITTATDSRRPFIVEAAHGSLRALGTRFTVRAEPHESLLAVYEGAVEARNTASSQVVPAGWQMRFTATGMENVTRLDPARQAWVRGVVFADQLPLGELVAELGRYHHGHLGVAPDVAGLPVIGTFPAQDTDTALKMLEESLPVRVRRTLPWWVTIEARH